MSNNKLPALVAPLLPQETIENSIIVVRDQQVILDSDLAYFFGVETKYLNRQMKRNVGRFPEDFCFQLNSKEFKSLRSQIVTFDVGYKTRKYTPYAYTEHGIIAIAGVLKSDIAAQMSVQIARTFIAMRKFIIENSDTLLSLAKLQNRQITFEESTNKRFDEIMKLIESKDIPKQTIFFDKSFYDAYEFIVSIIQKAKSSLIIIDPYCDNKAFSFLKHSNSGVSISLYISNKSKIDNEEIERFINQYGPIEIYNLETYHDRFIIIDNQEGYILGTSLNYAGNRTFAINKIETISAINHIVDDIRSSGIPSENIM